MRRILDTNTHAASARVDASSTDKRPFLQGPDPKTWKGHWTVVTDPETMAVHIYSANVHQYHQAINKPFVAEHLPTKGALPPQNTTNHLLPETKAVL
jgi:hypothetical protein